MGTVSPQRVSEGPSCLQTLQANLFLWPLSERRHTHFCLPSLPQAYAAPVFTEKWVREKLQEAEWHIPDSDQQALNLGLVNSQLCKSTYFSFFIYKIIEPSSDVPLTTQWSHVTWWFHRPTRSSHQRIFLLKLSFRVSWQPPSPVGAAFQGQEGRGTEELTFDPDLAIVPRLDTNSSCVIPMPVS